MISKTNLRPNMFFLSLTHSYTHTHTHTHTYTQIATHGWKLLPQYTLDTSTGQYKHRDFDNAVNIRSMAEINITREPDHLNRAPAPGEHIRCGWACSLSLNDRLLGAVRPRGHDISRCKEDRIYISLCLLPLHVVFFFCTRSVYAIPAPDHLNRAPAPGDHFRFVCGVVCVSCTLSPSP